MYNNRPGYPKATPAKNDLIITWNNTELKPNPTLEDYFTSHGGSASARFLNNVLSVNWSETNVIDRNTMDVNEENDTTLEVNAILTHDCVTDNSVEMDCYSMSANTESSNRNKDEVDVSDSFKSNCYLINM